MKDSSMKIQACMGRPITSSNDKAARLNKMSNYGDKSHRLVYYAVSTSAIAVEALDFARTVEINAPPKST